MKVDTLVHSAKQLLTLTPRGQRGKSLGDLQVLADAGLAIREGRIVDVGPTRDLLRQHTADHQIDAQGLVLMPGFVDPHTHAMWIGDRTDEFQRRIAGESYSEILAAGGGILSTVRETREASTDQLVKETLPRLEQMLAHGTTTCEIKTGYGLEMETELRMLEAIARLRGLVPMTLVATFLPAHALPEEFASRPEDYVREMVEKLLPEAMRRWRSLVGDQEPLFADVFCDKGAFDLNQARRILERARDLGYLLKIHADEFETLGAVKLAVELGAASADHLVATPSGDIQALGLSSTVAVSLPGTSFGLGERSFTPADRLLEANALVALGSDLNPGTSPCESMQMILAIACRYLHLTPAQAIAASTINAAAALRREDQLGSLTPGKQADLIAFQVPSYLHLGYHYGTNLVKWVLQRGQLAYSS
ncbi:MAG: imidazolonepropionase [Anaerolineales bacterium]|jgi:imidazolonepropionase